MKNFVLIGFVLWCFTAHAEEVFTLDTQKGMLVAGEEKIRSDTSYSDVQKKSLKPMWDGALYAGEGTCLLGTKIFFGRPAEVELFWKDTPVAECYSKSDYNWRSFKSPSYAKVSRTDSPWKTDTGIRVGTTLEELETISGGSVGFIGFGWDMGGSCCMGKFSEHIGFTLEADPEVTTRKSEASAYYSQELVGDKRIESKDIPADIKKKLNIRVKEIILNF